VNVGYFENYPIFQIIGDLALRRREIGMKKVLSKELIKSNPEGG
jgi:hypothetical protein